MRAAYYERFGGPIYIENLPDPQPSDDGVVIKVEASGICLSDWHGWMGHDPDIRLPHVPGHEFSGLIVAVGKSIRNFQVGDRVTVPFVGGCGKCEYCKVGDQQVCDNQFQPGFTAWGSFAEYVAIDYADENLVSLPEEIDFLSAASLGCRFITAYRALKDQAKLINGQFVAIHGCGGVGLSAVQIAKALGATVIAVDIAADKCTLAAELGADFTLNASRQNIIEAIKELSRGGVHISLDAVGSSTACLNSIHSLRKRGKHIQIGLMTEEHASPKIPMPMIIANELEIIGSHGMQAHKYPEMFHLVQNSGIKLRQMITETIRLEEVSAKLPVLNTDQNPGITIINSF